MNKRSRTILRILYSVFISAACVSLIFSLMTSSCAEPPISPTAAKTPPSAQHTIQVLVNDYRPEGGINRVILIEVDGCQYVMVTAGDHGVPSVVHKANCPNILHQGLKENAK